MYDWRKISEKERAKALLERKSRKIAWHAPPHFEYKGKLRFIVTAACYEHQHIIGTSPVRMAECEENLIKVCKDFEAKLFAWCILPNHYHLLIETDRIKLFQKDGLGKFHGGCSYRWNSEDNLRGRKIWYKSFEHQIQSNRHFMATLNYIHHNPVKHGYVSRWHDWTYSSARNYLEKVGRQKAAENWREYPILDYGKDWDFD